MVTDNPGVDAVFGEILVTLAKIDWIINHGGKAIAPNKRVGNLLLAHKVSTVSLSTTSYQQLIKGPLRAFGHDARSGLLELLFPQSHLTNLGLPLCWKHCSCQMLGTSRLVVTLVHWRNQGLFKSLSDQSRCRPACRMHAGRSGDGDP